MKKLSMVAIFTGVFLIPLAMPLFADGQSDRLMASAQPTLDPRLPPVIPGEPVERGGARIKVWSSSGPVSVNEPPAAPATGSLGVIVDQRGDHRSEYDRRNR